MDFNIPIDDGYAFFDVEGICPVGYINGFSSPFYEGIFLDIDTAEVIELQTSGVPVTSFIFQIMPGASSFAIFTINY